MAIYRRAQSMTRIVWFWKNLDLTPTRSVNESGPNGNRMKATESALNFLLCCLHSAAKNHKR